MPRTDREPRAGLQRIRLRPGLLHSRAGAHDGGAYSRGEGARLPSGSGVGSHAAALRIAIFFSRCLPVAVRSPRRYSRLPTEKHMRKLRITSIFAFAAAFACAGPQSAETVSPNAPSPVQQLMAGSGSGAAAPASKRIYPAAPEQEVSDQIF